MHGAVVQVGSSQCVICVLAALLLAAIVATCTTTRSEWSSFGVFD